jgi:hypothetical protein
MRKSFSLEAGLIRKKKDVSSDHDAIGSDEKKKEKERVKREKKEKKEKEKKEKELKKKRGGKTVTVFNSTLEEVMSLQEESDGEVPVILKTLTDAIFSLNGMYRRIDGSRRPYSLHSLLQKRYSLCPR